MTTTPHVLVVEDHEDLADGLRNNLEIEGYRVSVASDGPGGLRVVSDDPPDLVVLDLMLPGIDGFEVLSRLRKGGFTAPVLLLTARGEEEDKVRGLKLGADDYVTKPFGVLELLARVEAKLRRADGRVIERRPERWILGEVVVDAGARTVVRGEESIDLAPKELDLLVALLRREGDAVSREELLEEVWGYGSGVVSRTVDTHVAEVRRKLGEDGADPRFLQTVRKFGYRLTGARRVVSETRARG